jgi:hypothetical protein
MPPIPSLLLNLDEYNKKEFSVPYIYHIEKSNQLLAYFGATHTYDQTHPQFQKLEQEWRQFDSFPSKRKIAFSEGGLRPSSGSLEDALQKHGEQGYLKWLADQSGIEIFCPDPDVSSIYAGLKSKYSQDEIFYYLVIEIAYQWNRTDKRNSFPEYFRYYVDKFKNKLQWPRYDFSIVHAKILHKQIFGSMFDPNATRFFARQLDPAQKNSKFNQLSRDETILRDVAIVAGIKEYWEKGYSIFVVFGSGHAVIQERALKQLLT